MVNMNKIYQIESGGDHMITSKDQGAVGLGQIRKPALKDWNEAHPKSKYSMEMMTDPKLNKQVSEWYMNERIPQMLEKKKVPVTEENQILAYYMGAGAVSQYVKGGTPKNLKGGLQYLERYKKATPVLTPDNFKQAPSLLESQGDNLMAGNDQNQDPFSIESGIKSKRLQQDRNMEYLMDPEAAERKRMQEQGTEQKDAFSGVGPEQFFDNSGKTKKAMELDFRQFVAKGTQLIHSKQTRENVFKALQKGNPVENVANVTLAVVNKVDRAMSAAGQEMSDAVRMAAANQLMGQVLEVGEVSGLAILDDDEKKASFSHAVSQYIQEGINSGKIDKDALAEEAGRSVFEMSPEQRSQVDAEMKRINEAAVASEDKWNPDNRYATLLSRMQPMDEGEGYGA